MGWANVGNLVTASRYSATIGDGVSTSFVVNHNLGTRSVLVSVYDAATYVEINCDKERTDANNLTLGFASPPATGAYVVVVIGGVAAGGPTVASTDITDSTPTGRAILTATNAAAVNSALGLNNVDNTSDATKNSAAATLTNKTIDLDSNTLVGTTAEFNAALYDNEFATLSGTETLTNKTISGATNTLTNIPTSALPYSGVQNAVVATSESTSSTTYTDLTTTTDSVTVTVPASGLVLVMIYCNWTSTSSQGFMSYAISGAVNNVAATDAKSVAQQAQVASNIVGNLGATFLEVLTPGSTTFKLKYRASSSTQTFSNRRITVIPL